MIDQLKPVIFTLLLLVFSLGVLGNTDFDDRIRRLNTIPEQLRFDTIALLLNDLTFEHPETELKFTREILKIENKHDGLNYFIVLRHYARIAPSGNQALFDSCIVFARKNNLSDYISSVYVLKSNFFRKDVVYDSSMIYILLARDEAIKYSNIEQQANVLEILGDLYYSTGLYSKAKSYYLQVQKIKGNKTAWDSWRRRVIRNNLGQLELQDGHYNKAEIGRAHV